MHSKLNIALLACALLVALPASAQRLYKYTDPATGKTVYTERLPAEAAGKGNEQLNRQGIEGGNLIRVLGAFGHAHQVGHECHECRAERSQGWSGQESGSGGCGLTSAGAQL